MKTKKILSFLIIAAVMATMCLFATMAVSADEYTDYDGIEVPGVGSFKKADFSYFSDTKGTEVTMATPTDLPILDLSTESLITSNSKDKFVIEGYAINGKWKSGEPSEKDLASLFNKGGTLELANKMSDKAKDGPHKGVSGKVPSPTGDGNDGEVGEPCAYVIKYAKIEPRGKTPKLVPNYVLYEEPDFTPNPTNANNPTAPYGFWTLSEKGKLTTVYSGIENDTIQIVKPAGTKLEDTDIFDYFPCEGIPVLGAGDGDKIGGKVLYFIQVAAYVDKAGKYYPATKAVKLSVSAASKAPKIKPDYKTGTIKVKAGLAVSVASATDINKLSLEETKRYGKTADSKREVPIIAMPAKDKMPKFADMAFTMTGKTVIGVYTYATEKKPASLVQTIELAPPAAKLTNDAGISFDGKKVIIPKTLEAKNKLTDAKWGSVKIAPKASGTTEFFVRTKSTAKSTKPGDDNVTGYDGESASDYVKVTITWSKDADGVISATITSASVS